MSATLARNPNPQSMPQDGAPMDGTLGAPSVANDPALTCGSTSEELLEKFMAWHKIDRDRWQEWRQEAAEMYDFRAGHQWTDEDLQILADQMRPSITFNRIGPFIDAVGGLEINNRQETSYVPRQVGATGVNDILTAAAQWVRQECDAEDEETEAFLDVVTCGIGCCLSGDALVRLPRTHFTTERHYTGGVVHISMENGKSLSGTPNHPILTDAGWKRLREINEGDYLVNSAFLEQVKGFPLHQFDHVETRFEDKVNSLRVGREGRRTFTSANDFYGDGMGSKVHVVYADRELWDKIDYATRRQRIKQTFLAQGHIFARGCLSLLRESLFNDAVFAAEGNASVGVGHSPGTHVPGDERATKFMTGLSKAFANRFIMQSDAFADFLCGQFEVEVKPTKLFDGDLGHRARLPGLPFAEDVSSADKPKLNRRMTYSDLAGDFREWKPDLEIQAREFFRRYGRMPEMVTRVVSRRISFEREFIVHDVGTALGMFLAGDIITSNTQTRMDYDDDPDGVGRIDRIDPLSVYPDSGSKKQNFADGKRVTVVSDIPLDDARALFPDVAEQDLDAQWARDQPDETRSPHNARLAPYYRIDQAGEIDRDTQLCRLVEVEWWQFEPAYRVLDPTSSRFVMLSDRDATRWAVACRAAGVSPVLIKDKRKRYYRAIVGARVLKVMKGAEVGGFSYKFITGKRDQTKGTWYGLVRAMRDPQMWANKWLSQGLHILNTNAKGGYFAETDAFADIDEARDSIAESNSIVEVNPGKLDGVRPKDPPAFPPQLNNMLEMAQAAFPMVSGINMELMGQSTSTAPQVALLEAGRKQQGMNVLAALFNAKRRYQKEQGRLLLWMIQTYIADGRLIRIGGPENAQYVELIHEPGVAEYDVIVDDAPTSTNMKERVWGALMQMFPMLRGMQIPPQFYVNALKYAPVPESFVKESQDILSQPPPPDPLLQGKEAEAAARAKLLEAQAGKAVADTHKTIADAGQVGQGVDLDREQKEATIEKTRADAINALQNAGIIENDQRFQQTMAAINALLSVHGAVMDARDQKHRHGMEVAGAMHGQQMDQAGQSLAERQAAQQAAQQQTAGE